jgi:hypothetical protein
MISLCIPWVEIGITKSQIYKIIEKMNFCTLGRVDIIRKKNKKGQEFQKVFLHIQKWNSSSQAMYIKDRILSGKDIKIVYDFPWFWKISLTKYY